MTSDVFGYQRYDPSDQILLLPPHEQTVSAIDAARCQFDAGGHEWIDVTTISDLEYRYLCARCGAKGRGGSTFTPLGGN